MNINQLKLIYFSPTGTTKKILEGIVKGINTKHVEHIDLTLPQKNKKVISIPSDELTIIGMPVYGGRLPVDAINRIKQITASNTLAIIIVLYGNREFEDALLELKNLAVELGFIPFSGGAFIGEHSFATEDLPIANGRPDDLDIQKAVDFGSKIKEKITKFEPSDRSINLEIPGKFPYEAKGGRAMKASPATKEETCIVCGTCATLCPTAAISIKEKVVTETGLCIRCCACIKGCPTGSRIMENSAWKKVAYWLNENCTLRKEPQTFMNR